jgi:hypothetical protein
VLLDELLGLEMAGGAVEAFRCDLEELCCEVIGGLAVETSC